MLLCGITFLSAASTVSADNTNTALQNAAAQTQSTTTAETKQPAQQAPLLQLPLPAEDKKTEQPTTAETNTAQDIDSEINVEQAASTAPELSQSIEQPAIPQQGWPVSVWLNGEAMPLSIPTVLDNGVTFISVYDFCTIMGCTVEWREGCAVVQRKDELDMRCTPGAIYMTANGRALYLSTPARIINDRIMLPVRALATVFDMTVSWDGELKRVYLNGGGLLKSGSSYYDADTLYWLSRIISAEARGEPLHGQIAVGNVVFNRISDNQFPNTVYGVIFDKENGVQFTPTETGDIYAKPKDISVLAAKLCLEGADYSCGATYFISEKVTECWAMSNKKLVTSIGGHRFYG